MNAHQRRKAKRADDRRFKRLIKRASIIRIVAHCHAEVMHIKANRDMSPPEKIKKVTECIDGARILLDSVVHS